jgi:uncharacterized protein (UPF0297 family)
MFEYMLTVCPNIKSKIVKLYCFISHNGYFTVAKIVGTLDTGKNRYRVSGMNNTNEINATLDALFM